MTFTFCFAPKLISILIILLAILVIVGYVKKEFSFKFYLPHLFLSLLYVAYMIGIFFTNNATLASGYAENKLSFIVFPILFSFLPRFKLRLNETVIGLVAGTIIASFIGLKNGFGLMSTGLDFMSSFTSSNFSSIHHPSYFAMFLLIAAMGSIWAYQKKQQFFSLKWVIPYVIFAFLMVLLCLSLAGILFLLILITLYVFKDFYKRFGRNKLIILIFLSPLILFTFLSITPRIKDDFNSSKNALLNYLNSPTEFFQEKPQYLTGSEVRLAMWTVSATKIKENPLGVGTGNVDDYLSTGLQEVGLEQLIEFDYNPHNQYLQTALEIGLFGLLVLFLFLGSAFKIAWKSKDKLLLLVLSTLIFNSLFESMLQRQSGIVFYSFMICLLVVHNEFSKKEFKKIET